MGARDLLLAGASGFAVAYLPVWLNHLFAGRARKAEREAVRRAEMRADLTSAVITGRKFAATSTFLIGPDLAHNEARSRSLGEQNQQLCDLLVRASLHEEARETALKCGWMANEVMATIAELIIDRHHEVPAVESVPRRKHLAESRDALALALDQLEELAVKVKP